MSRQPVVPRLVGLAAAALSIAAPVAAADNGIRIGEGRLHPYFEVEGRYDSNVLYTSKPIGDLILHLRPGFTFDVSGPMAAVGLDASADWNKYFGVNDAGTEMSQLFADATLKLGLNRGGNVGLELSDAFHRSDRTPSLSLASAVVTNYNDLKLQIPFRPGGGALELGVGGEWILESFEPFAGVAFCDPARSIPCSQFGYNQFSGGVSGRWKFLPRTAALVEASYFLRQPNDTNVSRQIKGLKALAGLAGLVTPRIAATLKAGYGDTLGSAGPDYRTWLANVELDYRGEGTIGAKIGYARDYGSDPGTVFALYGIHRIYLEGKVLLAGRLTITGQGEFDDVEYQLTPASSQLVRLSPSLEYELVRWAYVSLGYAITYRTSNQPQIPTFDYTKNETWLKVRVIY